VRPANVSATDQEKAGAMATAERVRRDLRGRDWPEPIFSDSGNGYHLLYRIDLPADDGGKVERILAAIANLHDSDQVKIDTVVHNQSRICKLPGTWSKKGENTPERPWRLAQMLEAPSGDIAPVPLDLLNALASEAPDASPAGNASANTFTDTCGSPNRAVKPDGGYTSRLLVGEWLRDSGREVVVKHKLDGTYFEIDCPFHSDHSAAFIQRHDGQNGFHCFHARCKGYSYQDAKGVIGPQDGRRHYDPPLLRVAPWDDPEFAEGFSDEMIAVIFGREPLAAPTNLTALLNDSHSPSHSVKSNTLPVETMKAILDQPIPTSIIASIASDRKAKVNDMLCEAGLGLAYDSRAIRTCGHTIPLRSGNKRLRLRVCCRRWTGCDHCLHHNRHLAAKRMAGVILNSSATIYRIATDLATARRLLRRRDRADFLRVAQGETGSVVIYTTSPTLQPGAAPLTPLDAATNAVRDIAIAAPVTDEFGRRANPLTYSARWAPTGDEDDTPKNYTLDTDATVLAAAGVPEAHLIDALRRCGIAYKELPGGISSTTDHALRYVLDDVRHRRLIQWLTWAAQEGERCHEMIGWDSRLRWGPYDVDGDVRCAHSSYWTFRLGSKTDARVDRTPGPTIAV